MRTFNPAFYLRNKHLQTFIAAAKFRYSLLLKRSQPLLAAEKISVLRTTQDVRIQVAISSPANAINKLAIVFHGWEGSADSSYVISSGQALFALGYHVARVNFRDHGDTYHLNKSPFNSMRIDEICDVILQLARQFPEQGIVLLGFSLGGNFTLRLAASDTLQHLPIEHSIAICPAINPVHSSNTIERGGWLYQKYFVNKWQNSLRKKYSYFPEIMHSPDDLKGRRLNEISEAFVPLHTDFKEPEEYLSAYVITQDTLNKIKHRCHMIYADDDPIIYSNDFDALNPTAFVTISPQPYGGHCAFLQDWRLTSWVDNTLPEILCE